ncbi:gliding motility-associated ABC transporter permease subunit GldF [Dyadobacter chenwenxiniae]|uniref:Gliding motility-associated ABC transporter permease subunit GldF n=1 Tax=Dyadobacter chenwenxiniae TaxID=2906456 RepID=A0A9X1TE93_9BACT|nr:gliding motility-associated ABC transporter permease subunit GldF [Dyadobacter chenwenxiniae]MCF0061479.1 gliding motility-associated ABC transporter permease subunit GldF [Dyadobacter chenwenxiniae]UON81302.1 gliding motility-associated ABC transporter permease subunit GldF [Dyadobacter chenwenxiniae]
MFAIFQKEIGSFFNSLIAYIVMAAFLTAVGLIVWVFPDSNILDYGYADLGSFFQLAPYVLLFLIPAITMRSIAEEARNGTLELLLTKPLQNSELVLGKFFANWVLVALTLLPTLIYYYSIYKLGNPEGNVDSAAVFGSYIGLLLFCGVIVSMGIWTSSLTDNQIVAFIVCVFLAFIWYIGFGALAQLAGVGPVAELLNWAALDQQYLALGKGLVDSRNIIYLLSLMALFLFLAYWRIEKIRK